MINQVTLSATYKPIQSSFGDGANPTPVTDAASEGKNSGEGIPKVASTTTTQGGTSEGADASGKPGDRKEAPEDIADTVSQINKAIQAVRRDLVFEVDKSTDKLVVKVVNQENGEVVRQIPPEEVLDMLKRMNELAEKKTGVFLKDQA
jgi:flagellar protein FlaG